MMILANDWAIREHTDPPMSEMLPTATRVEASPEENQSKRFPQQQQERTRRT